jgi:hypothetical protein
MFPTTSAVVIQKPSFFRVADKGSC